MKLLHRDQLDQTCIQNLSQAYKVAIRCAIIAYKHGMYEFPHELPNDLRLRILAN